MAKLQWQVPLTSSDEKPVGVVRSQLVLDRGLHKVSPLGDNELVVILQDLSVSSNEVRSRDVTHSDATSSISHLNTEQLKQERNREVQNTSHLVKLIIQLILILR